MVWLWIIGLYIAGAIVAAKFFIWLDDCDDDDTLIIITALWPMTFPLALIITVIAFLICAIIDIAKR